MTPWCPSNKVEWYKVIILLAHISETARTDISLCGVILHKSESNRQYLPAYISTFLIAALDVGNLFCAKYR